MRFEFHALQVALHLLGDLRRYAIREDRPLALWERTKTGERSKCSGSPTAGGGKVKTGYPSGFSGRPVRKFGGGGLGDTRQDRGSWTQHVPLGGGRDDIWRQIVVIDTAGNESRGELRHVGCLRWDGLVRLRLTLGCCIKKRDRVSGEADFAARVWRGRSERPASERRVSGPDLSGAPQVSCRSVWRHTRKGPVGVLCRWAGCGALGQSWSARR